MGSPQDTNEKKVLKVARLHRPWFTSRDCGHIGSGRKVRSLLRNMIRNGLLSPMTAYHRVGGTVLTAYREARDRRPVEINVEGR